MALGRSLDNPGGRWSSACRQNDIGEGMADLTGDDAPAAVVATAAERPASAGLGVRIWGVVLLGLIATVSSIDRQCFSALLTPMKRELNVSDLQMGILSGSAATLVYTLVALPLARLIDRSHRRNLLTGLVAVWSVATALCGFATGYLQLLFARFTVGAAESGQLPASMSMVGDMFPARNRGTAVAMVLFGSAMGFGLGAILAGALADRYGWRVAMMVVGGPGLLLAALFLFTVREPVRGAQDAPGHGQARESILQCLRRLSRIGTLYPFTVGWVLMGACNAGWLVWGQTFYVRVHHLSNAAAGAAFGVGVLGALPAAMVGGPLSDWLARRGARWRLYYCCAAISLAAPFQVATLLVENVAESSVLIFLYSLISGGVVAVGMATYVSFAPPTMRAFITAFMTLCSAVLGASVAPALYGGLNDALAKTYGDDSLRYTLLLSPALLVLAAVMFLVASRTVDHDVAAAALPPEPIA